jgi:ornithine--oxo-acid transaminase
MGTNSIVGYMLEPIQGEAGVNIPSSDYLKQVRALCTQYNVLMIADEVQCGLGRTGKLLCSDHVQVRPDILVLGKALSGGFYPVSCAMADNEIMDLIKPGEHGSTYGGNPLASAVGKKAIEVLIEEQMIENSAV